MKKRITTEEFIQRSKKIHDDKYDYSESIYENYLVKVKIICPLHGEFYQLGNHHMCGRGCIKCGIINKKKTTEEFIKECNSRIEDNKYNTRYNFDDVIYNGAKEKVKIKCDLHGYFMMSPNNFLNGQGCPSCSSVYNSVRQIKEKEVFIKEAKKIKPDYDYSNVNYKRSNWKVKIKCNIENHGYFLIRPHNLLNGQGCPVCGGTKKLTTEEFVERCKKKNPQYNYSDTKYKNASTKVNLVCKKHGIFWKIPSHIQNGSGCPKCTNIVSVPEMEFLNYLNIPDKKENRQVFLKIVRIKADGLIKNTIYEFLGDYWHGNPIKFNKNDINKNCKKTFGELYNKTIEKFKKLKTLGYKVKYIWENDWNNFKKGIDETPKVKEYI